MQIALHKNARTTPAVRALIAASDEAASVLTQRFGITEQTVYKWKKRESVQDRSQTAHRLQTQLTPAQEMVVVHLRRTLLAPLDDSLAVTCEFICSTVARSGLDRCLRGHGVGNLNALKPAEPIEAHKAFKSNVPGYLLMDVKYLPLMQDEPKRRYLQGHIQQEKSGQETKTYSYNAAERLTQYESSEGMQAHYRYDPFGRRISKSVIKDTAKQVTYFVYSEQALMGELDKDGKLQRAYGFNPVAGQQALWSTDPVWQAAAVNSELANNLVDYYYLHTDHLGTAHVATDKTGVATWKVISESFGAMGAIENSVEVSLRFPGQYFDKENQGFYNFRRDYKPNMGRFLQSDPMGLYDGVNLYSYVKNVPILNIDPLGLAVTWKGSTSGGSAVHGAGVYWGVYS